MAGKISHAKGHLSQLVLILRMIEIKSRRYANVTIASLVAFLFVYQIQNMFPFFATSQEVDSALFIPNGGKSRYWTLFPYANCSL